MFNRTKFNNKLDAFLADASLSEKKLKDNVYARRLYDGAIVIKYHATDIVVIGAVTTAGMIQLDNGGWYTVTTKDVMNAVLNGRYGISVYQRKGRWYVGQAFGDELGYSNGMIVIACNNKKVKRA